MHLNFLPLKKATLKKFLRIPVEIKPKLRNSWVSALQRSTKKLKTTIFKRADPSIYEITLRNPKGFPL